MTARVITQSGRIFVEATLSEFHTAKMFLAFQGVDCVVRMGAPDVDAATRTAALINQCKRDRDAAALNRSRA